MTQKEKLLQDFCSQPKKLSYQKIKNFLSSEGYLITEGKGSHTKIKHLPSGKVFIVPLHNGDCKEIYKEKLKEFYLNNLK